jgi:hypothetical protein
MNVRGDNGDRVHVTTRRVAVVSVALVAGVVVAGSSAFADTERRGELVSLTVRVEGSGAVNDDAGFTCRTTCVRAWDKSDPVSLFAEADDGFAFAYWGGYCQFHYDDQLCMIFLEQYDANEADAVAVFRRVAKLTIAVRGRGVVTGRPSYPWRTVSGGYGFTCPSVCSRAVFAGYKVKLFAHGKRGWKFVRWTSGCRGTRPTCVITIRRGTRVTSTFDRT